MFAQFDFKLKKVLIIGIGISLLGMGTLVMRGSMTKDVIYEVSDSESRQEGEVEAGVAEEIAVHVGGAVAKPDVYFVSIEARVNDVISLAEPLEDAYLDGLNLAMPVQDGQKIFVPTTESYQSSNLLNLNTASKADLTTLPGIGNVTAQKIIDHRERYGPFYALEDLLRIDGIGDAKVSGIKDLVSVF